ncbi:MAG: translocation/assembly module TamB [Muribaculaceae bacterium]|nr:translocation/assembly module TamB [Muribaculaceae bacterium]
MLGALLLALILLVTGILGLVYSDWAQESARRAVVERFSSGDMQISLDRFRLRFPLSVSLDGLCIRQDGDTLVAARSADLDAAVLPLLAGRVHIDRAALTGVDYRMGAPDSAMFMTIHADSLGLKPATVRLSDMDINLQHGAITGGRLAMMMNIDTMPPTPAAPPQQMTIRVGDIALDDFGYTMRMLPSIDTLSAHIAHGTLAGGTIDMLRQSIDLRSFGGHGLDVRYIAPDSATVAACAPLLAAVPAADSISAAAPWTVQIDTIAFDGGRALYTTAGVHPLPGLDFAYIDVDSLGLDIDHFYNRATTVRVPLTLSGTERCGVRLNIAGELDIDSVALAFKDVNLTTPTGTKAAFSGRLGMGDMMSDPTLPVELHLDGAFAPKDMSRMFPLYMPYFAAIPSPDDILLLADADGTMGHLDVDQIVLTLNNCVSMRLHGTVENLTDPDELGCKLDINGNIRNVNSFKRAMLDPATASSINIPPMTLGGHVNMHSGILDGLLTARTGAGSLALDARWNGRRENYDVNVKARSFPVQAFMPLMGVSDVTADITATGTGYDPFKASTTIDAKASVTHAVYQGTVLDGITATAHVAGGNATVTATADNPAISADVKAEGNLTGDTYRWTASVDGDYIDLYALKLFTEPASLEISLNADATIGPGKNDIDAKVVLDDLYFRRHSGTIGFNAVTANFHAADSITSVDLRNRDLTATFTTPATLDSLTASFSRFSEEMARQISGYELQVDSLAMALPPFALDVVGGRSNLVNDILAPSKMSVRDFGLFANNDSTLSLNGFARGFDTGSMRLDSLYINAGQHHDHLHFKAGMLNNPGNMDQWHDVALTGKIDGNTAAIALKQKNIKNVVGFDLGLAAEASAADSTITLHIRPTDPIIGYQQWQANDSNFISYTFPSKHIDVNLHMTGGNSALDIYTEEGEGHDSHAHNQEDLIIKLSDIHLSDWIAVNPFAPPIRGNVNADMRLNNHEGILTGNGDIGITDFFYGKETVADFLVNFNVSTTPSGTVHADADVMVDGKKTITLSGALNDSTAVSPMLLDLKMIHFPLATANPFIPSTVGRLQGMLNGNLKVTGDGAHPILNGTLDFDSTAVTLALTGTPYRFSTNPIDVTNSLVTFSDFAITGCNDRPLTVNGTVDISDLANAKVNLALDADNMMIVNSSRAAKGADIFGKAYVTLKANAQGSMSFMTVNADLSVNSGTNVTYIVPDAESVLADQSKQDMVRFVNFTDSAAVAAADSIAPTSLALVLDAGLTIQQGSIFNVYLNANGQNRVQVEPNGTLTYAMTPLDNGRLTGRLNIDKGYVRYTPPFMSEKLFNFDSDSYVAFTGEMMNPTLNIHAVDVLKANVTQSGQNSRLVNFDVLLAVTGTLNQMNVAFDLKTDDDITVANELDAMSPDQRANQAMNMLLYNIYTGPGTKGNASLAGNPLFSFLESQVNSWAANNIKGVDLSFGIDQYDRTVDGNTSSTMSYSYQVSKSLFNDRFKIVVGGNYTSDANADENFSQNLINDISFEYFLNDTRSMYVRLFRHTGYESILEGEITQTGVGFVYTRKLQRLGDMFIPVGVVRRRIQRANEHDAEILKEAEEEKAAQKAKAAAKKAAAEAAKESEATEAEEQSKQSDSL